LPSAARAHGTRSPHTLPYLGLMGMVMPLYG